jgi:hypothetical protein
MSDTYVNPQKARALAKVALVKATEYFKVDPKINIVISIGTLAVNTWGEIVLHHGYLKANIYVDLQQHSDYGTLWATLGHEIAHVCLWPVQEFGDSLGLQNKKNKLYPFYSNAVEQCVSTLELMWVRDNPMPNHVTIDGQEVEL